MADDHEAKLKRALAEADASISLALKSRERGERELFEQIAELHIKIAECLELLVDNS